MGSSHSDKDRVFAEDQRLMFGQVREDAAVDVWLLNQLNNPSSIFVIASGGCTAFSLLRYGCEVVALDISKAQIALVELKLLLFQNLGFDAARDACIADARSAYERVSSHLSPDSKAILDAAQDRIKDGLNNCGFVDRNMRMLARIFFRTVHSRQKTEHFLSLSDLAEEERYYNQEWCTRRWNLATSIAFNKMALSLIHGRAALELVPDDFDQVLRKKIERALTQFPNSTNCYVWQSFLAKYPGSEAGLPLYLQAEQKDGLTKNLSNLRLVCQDALSWFRAQPSDSFDLLSMSNVIELLPSVYADELMPEIIRCARKGAIICVRSIFPRLTPTFQDPSRTLIAEPDLTASAEAMDRSMFCNFFEIYRRM